MRNILVIILLFSLFFANLASAQEDLNLTNVNADNLLEKNIDVPQDVQAVARIVFGLKQGRSVELQELVILCSIIAVLFLIIREASQLIPFFDSSFKIYAGAILITLIISSTGTLFYITSFLISFAEKITRGIALVGFILILIAIFILLYGAFYFIRIMKRSSRLEENREAGLRTGMSRHSK